MSLLICDSESDGFKYEGTRIWIMCAYDMTTKIYHVSVDDSVKQITDVHRLLDQHFTKMKLNSEFRTYDNHEGLIQFMNKHTVCFHNYFQHDKPLIKKLYPSFSPSGEDDSFILSQLFNPDRGKHSLEAWGEKFGVYKVEQETWGKWDDNMVARIIEDVRINTRVWHKLMKEKEEWEFYHRSWDKAIKIEYGVADIQGRQELHGVLFDEEKAYALADEIYCEIQKLDEHLLKIIPPVVSQLPEVEYETKPFTKSGGLKTNVVKWFENENVWGQFRRVTFAPINLNSYDQIKDFLYTQGWVPTTWNYKTDKSGKRKVKDENGNYIPTTPKLTEDSYGSIKGDTGKLVAKRAVLLHRARMVFNVDKQGKFKGFLNIRRDDGRIEAGAITNSTNTGRMAHRNLVNVPKPKDKDLWPSNTQLRELFIVPEGRVMMGIDADALEARMEAHACLPYEGGEAYAFELLEGDVHAKNAIDFETDRDGAKAPKYALTYGCSPERLAETLGCSIQKATRLYNRFWDNNTALKGFKDAIASYWKRTGQSHIIGIDGRKIITRSEHSLVNAYFQSTGSIAVKVAALYLDKWVRAEGLDAQQIIIYHDEIEYEVSPEHAERLGELASKAFEEAGKFLGIRVPVTGSPSYGKNWMEVH